MKTRLVLIFAMVGGCLAWAAATARAAERFSSREGGFSVVLPSAPTVEDVAVGADPSGTQRQFTVAQDNGALLISYQDNPHLVDADAAALDKALLLGQETLRKAFFGRVLESQKIRLHGTFPGREFLVTIPSAGGICKARMFLVRGRLYQLLVVGELEAVGSPEATQMFDSFRLTQ